MRAAITLAHICIVEANVTQWPMMKRPDSCPVHDTARNPTGYLERPQQKTQANVPPVPIVAARRTPGPRGYRLKETRSSQSSSSHTWTGVQDKIGWTEWTPPTPRHTPPTYILSPTIRFHVRRIAPTLHDCPLWPSSALTRCKLQVSYMRQPFLCISANTTSMIRLLMR